eukprot:353371-Chlamydomonas_euryale.AAC.1
MSSWCETGRCVKSEMRRSMPSMTGSWRRLMKVPNDVRMGSTTDAPLGPTTVERRICGGTDASSGCALLSGMRDSSKGCVGKQCILGMLLARAGMAARAVHA